MGKDHDLQRILSRRLIAVIRLGNPERLRQVAQAIQAGGVDIIEFTMTTPGALHMVEECAQEFGEDVLLGAGTVLDAPAARAAILAGARFIVSPLLDEATLDVCRRADVVAIPGALTPTEIYRAWGLGADLVKVFPARLGGPRYIKDILDPLPELRLVPTGGVGVQNAAEFLLAGAAALALGRGLVSEKNVADARFDLLMESARRLVAAVQTEGT